MKIKLFTLLIVFSIGCSGQINLTNGQVYDFDIGDVIQGKYDIPWLNKTTYETKTILNKAYSVANDSIFYNIKKDLYSFIVSYTSTAIVSSSYTTSITTETVTNLSAIALHNNYTNCLPLIDTTYLDYCNKHVWEKYYGLSVSCTSQPYMETTYLVMGLGGPYYNFYNGPAVSSFPAKKYELVYYSKTSGSCGVLVTGINESVLKENYFSIYPNPSDDYIYIKSSYMYKGYDIINLYGQLVQFDKNNFNFIDITKLSSGSYILCLYSTDNKIHRQKFIKN